MRDLTKSIGMIQVTILIIFNKERIMSRTIRFTLVNMPFERRGETPRGMVVFKSKKKSVKGGRQAEKRQVKESV